MTNAELIKALRYCGQAQDVIDCADCERRMIENGVDVDCEGRLLRDAADALEADEARMPKWISVKDNLPDSQRPVLVYVPESEDFCEYVGMADYTWSPKGGFWCGTDGETYGAIGFIRTPMYWMEIPQPPNCGAKMRTGDGLSPF